MGWTCRLPALPFTLPSSLLPPSYPPLLLPPPIPPPPPPPPPLPPPPAPPPPPHGISPHSHLIYCSPRFHHKVGLLRAPSVLHGVASKGASVGEWPGKKTDVIRAVNTEWICGDGGGGGDDDGGGGGGGGVSDLVLDGLEAEPPSRGVIAGGLVVGVGRKEGNEKVIVIVGLLCRG
ncbi:unnamed protein product [Taenia asiatica]|uniref:Uncharacterized protein n=1 Tax=Taenia asiatica TaxID=60517 RepID=A0A0R3VX18_TAEAS|nr:unnamed protein product [Taenia asiatica]